MSTKEKVWQIESYPLQVKEEAFISFADLEDIIMNMDLDLSIKEKIFSHKEIQEKLNYQLEVINEPFENSVFTQSVQIGYDAFQLMKEVGYEKLLEVLKQENTLAIEYLFGDGWVGIDEFIEDVRNHIIENIDDMEEWDWDKVYSIHTHANMQGHSGMVHGTLDFQIRTNYDGEYSIEGLHETTYFEINKVWNLRQHELVEGKYVHDKSEEALEESKKRLGKFEKVNF